MNKGFVKLYRSILDDPVIMKDAEHFSIWIYLALKCSFGKAIVLFDGEKKQLKPGQIITGRKKIGEDLNMSESKVQRVLSRFTYHGIIEQQTTGRGRLVTLLNWGENQFLDADGSFEMNKGRTTSEQDVNTLKEGKKEKNENLKLSKLKGLNNKIDKLIATTRKKCQAYDLIYDPAQERRFAHNILKDSFMQKINEMGFDEPEKFVETIIDMSMQPGNWWQHKIAGLRDIHRNYPKVYAGYMSAKKEQQFISSF